VFFANSAVNEKQSQSFDFAQSLPRDSRGDRPKPISTGGAKWTRTFLQKKGQKASAALQSPKELFLVGQE